jgi:hypothetical protein
MAVGDVSVWMGSAGGLVGMAGVLEAGTTLGDGAGAEGLLASATLGGELERNGLVWEDRLGRSLVVQSEGLG